MTKSIRVMVIDDSIVYRSWLIQSLEADQRFEVVGFAGTAFEAKQKIPALQPDLLTLDIEMPGMSGIEFLKQLLPVHPIPVILVSSLNLRVFDALEAGAVDFVRKPDGSNALSKELFLQTLKSKLVIASGARVHLPSASPATPPRTTGRTALPRAGVWDSGVRDTGVRDTGTQNTVTRDSALPSRSAGFPDARKPGAGHLLPPVIAIGASTGGTEAILEVVRHFPAKTPGVVITQHMPAGFTAMYAERLNRICTMEVREAKNGDHLHPGLILLAPGGMQMRLVPLGSSYSVSVLPGEKVNGHHPSVDVLFDSVAMHARERAIGVLLTGMGADGAAGLLRMRKNGAYTIGQDRDSCVVYGMPMEAWNIGAVCRQLPLHTIGQAVLNRLSGF